jgi:glutathione S-transferase
MPDLKLVIGTKNLSSWSLRPWFFLRQNGIPFSELVIELDRPETQAEILRYSPSGRVPALIDQDLTVWESLAICEHLAERLGIADAWPSDPAARAMARSVAAEMHSGYAALRREMSFEATRRPEAVALSPEASADVMRIREIWREARSRFGEGNGEWLFGRFGIADAMFAPVALRFYGYAVPLDGPEQQYLWQLISSAVMREWIGGAFLDLAVQKPRESTSVPATSAATASSNRKQEPAEPAARPAATAPSPAPVAAASSPGNGRTPPSLGTPTKTSAKEQPAITVKSYILPP